MASLFELSETKRTGNCVGEQSVPAHRVYSARIQAETCRVLNNHAVPNVNSGTATCLDPRAAKGHKQSISIDDRSRTAGPDAGRALVKSTAAQCPSDISNSVEPDGGGMDRRVFDSDEGLTHSCVDLDACGDVVHRHVPEVRG